MPSTPDLVEQTTATPGPPLAIVSTLVCLSGAVGVGVGTLFWAEGMNPRWVLGLVALLLLAAAVHAWRRGSSYSVLEAELVLLGGMGALTALSFTTDLPLGALRDGVAVPMLGAYVGWFFRRPAIWCFYALVVVWLVAVAAQGDVDLATIAVALAAQTVIGAEAIRMLVRRLRCSARRDPLTGTLNRLGLDELGTELVSDAHRSGRPFCLALIDLDGLREVNNAGGHAEGDLLLRQAAAEWQAGLRPGWSIGRLGGDEFVLLMPDTSLDSARERLAEMEEDATVAWTVGIAELAPGEWLGRLVRRADHEMYARKDR